MGERQLRILPLEYLWDGLVLNNDIRQTDEEWYCKESLSTALD